MIKQIFDDLVHLGRIIYKNLPDVNGGGMPLLSTTPSIANLNLAIFQNVVPVTVTKLIGGAQYQSLRIKGDGQTTIEDNASIETNTGADKLLAVNKIYTFTLIDEVWYESE